MKQRLVFLSIIFFLFWGLLGCSATLPRTSYLARVNQDLITMEDLRYEFKKRHGGHEKFLAGEVEIKRFLNTVVDSRLLLQEAYRLGLQEDSEIVNATNDFQTQRLTEYLIKKEVDEKSKVTDEEIKAIYEQKMEEQVQVQQIIVALREEAEEISKRIQSGEDFEAIAREKSIAPSKKYGGRLPPLGWGFMDPEWERIAFKLSPGEVSPVFKSRMGYEIIRLESIKTSAKPEFDKVKSQIKAVLERRKLEERRRDFKNFLQSKYPVKIANVDLTVEHLKKALDQKTNEPLATWPGGTLSVYAFASQLNLDLLATLSVDRVRGQIKEILEEIIHEKLIQQEALSRGYDKVSEVAEKVRQHREGLMESKLYGNYIFSDIKVTPEDLQQYFEQNRKEFTLPEKRKVAHILVESLDSAKDVLKKFKEGEGFEILARTLSKDSQTSGKGGEIGWIGKGQVLPSIEKAAFSIKAGEVSDPVKTDLGYHLIKLLEIQPSQLKDFSQAKKEVEKRVFQKKKDDKIRFWIDKLKAVSQIEINEEGIQAAVKKVQTELSKEMDKSLDKEKDKN